jgi:hypothetical protein
VVWNLQDGSEGPPLIDYSVTQKSRLSPPLLLMAHLKIELHSQLDDPAPLLLGRDPENRVGLVAVHIESRLDVR